MCCRVATQPLTVCYSLLSFAIARKADGSTSKSTRPVLDAVHERDEGNLRIRVNDGRQITATAGAAVEIALTNIGVVLFNPKTMVRKLHRCTCLGLGKV